MRNYVLLALFAASASALPLNINLGAYSPALVVGDGEISFGGKQDVSNLMSALEGAAVTGAAANNGAAAAAPATTAPAAAAPAAPAAQNAAPAAETVASTTEVASLQGMGKEIAPRVVKLERSDNQKRDIQTLNAALSYATNALTKGPQVELGTENAGVGILIKPPTAAGGAAAGTAAKVALSKREPVEMKTTVTRLYIRGGPDVASKKSISTARSTEDVASVEKREASPAIDGVNLNMAEGQVAELTFVETKAADDEE